MYDIANNMLFIPIFMIEKEVFSGKRYFFREKDVIPDPLQLQNLVAASG